MFKFFKKKEIEILSPVMGQFKKQQDIDDPVFSQGLMGNAFAIMPQSDVVCSPINGTIQTIFPTKHALGIAGDGLEVIVHIGLDTVKLKGECFELLVNEQQSVKKGDPLVKVDFKAISEKGYCTDVIVAIQTEKTIHFDESLTAASLTSVVGRCE